MFWLAENKYIYIVKESNLFINTRIKSFLPPKEDFNSPF